MSYHVAGAAGDRVPRRAPLQRLEKLDQRPAVVVAEVGAVFVAAVAIAVAGVDLEGSVLERRLGRDIADLLPVELAAADREAGHALLGGQQQLPEVRD